MRRETGLTHLYTIEANYNTARTLNVVAPASGDHAGRASPPCNKRFPPKFTVSAFHVRHLCGGMIRYRHRYRRNITRPTGLTAVNALRVPVGCVPAKR